MYGYYWGKVQVNHFRELKGQIQHVCMKGVSF